jgi:hypothetical protein
MSVGRSSFAVGPPTVEPAVAEEAMSSRKRKFAGSANWASLSLPSSSVHAGGAAPAAVNTGDG